MPLVSRSSVKPPTPQETLTPEARVRWDLIVAAIAAGVIIIDQITKAQVLNHFKGQHAYDVVPVIGNIVTLENWGNTGAAFSSFTQSPALLGFLILVAIGVIGWLYWSTRPRDNPWLKATFGLIIGGALGNLIDRVRLGYVVDFIHFQIPAIHFNFAVFNMADAAISIGVVALAIVFWTLPRESEEATGERLAGAAVAGATTATSAEKTSAPKTLTTAAKAAPTAVASRLGSAATKTPTNPVKTANGTAPKSALSVASKTPTNPVKTPAAATTAKPATGAVKAVAAGAAPKAAATKSAGSIKSKQKRR